MKSQAIVLILFLIMNITQQSQAKNTNNIHKVCASQASSCLELLPDELAKLRPRSNAWYKLKLYELESLFVLQQTERQRAVLADLHPVDAAPIVFQITAYLYLAKNAYFYKEFESAEHYSEIVFNLIEQVTETYPDPRKIVSLVNLKLYHAKLELLSDNEAAYTEKLLNALSTLESLREKFHNSYDPIFNRELYGNIGHTYARLDKHVESLQAYQTGLFWARQGVDLQQLSVSIYNVARAYQRLEYFDKALKEFELAKQAAINAKDEIVELFCYYQMADIYFNLNQIELVHRTLAHLKGRTLETNLSKYVKELQLKISNKHN
ncbi:hypothetical protein [uncultured Psychrosphaera sp.]|uniref:hypothetical protein n=1 Tax=uncultured Psychrosphaera sp. TaxID=1403522 RepID=UPI0030FD0FE1